MNPISVPLDSRIKPPSRYAVMVPPTTPYGNLQPGAPELPNYETNLRLQPDRVQFLKDLVLQRISDVSQEMGREDRGRVRPGSFMGIRQENVNTYEGDLEWRKALGGVFPTSNFSLSDNNRYARLLSARERDDLLGTRPFCSCMTTDAGDPELTKDVEMFVQGRLDLSNVGDALREGIRVANIVNESVIKTTYVRDVTTYFGPATVMVDNRGQPILTRERDYIYQFDDFFEDPNQQGVARLQKDPSFSMVVGTGVYMRFPRLEQKLVHYDNVHAEVLNFVDFLCPLKARHTWLADINAHLYEQTPERLRAQYPNITVADDYFLRRREAQTGAQQPKKQSGEEENRGDSLMRLLIAEVYIRCDADNDGQEEEIMVVMDLTNEDIVFYDYTGNHMSRRPFSVIPGVERIPGRWHAIGVFSKMRNPALYVDAQFNRINEKDSQNAAITYYHKDASEQWRSGIAFAPGSRIPIEVRAGWDPRVPIAGRINLQADASLGLDMLNLRRQSSDLEFAVLSSRDASASGLNASKTATGVMSVERDANVISKDTETDIAKGIEDQLTLTVELILDNMKSSELMFRNGESTLVTLNREEIRSLPRKVKLLLTKSKSAELLATREKAEAIFLRYMRLNPREQYYGRPLYIDELKGLEIDDADDRLPEVTKQEMEQWIQAQSQQKDQPPSESIAIKYGDLARSEQVQLLQKAGITPAQPNEIAQKLAGEAQLDAVKKGHGAPVPTILPPNDAGGGAGIPGLAA